jgi:Skp family chaperone for outer membrane proteins
VRYVTKIASILTVALATTVGAGLASTVHPGIAEAQAAPVIIAVIDSKGIMTQSTVGKGLQAAGNQRLQALETDTQKRRDALAKQGQLLEQQRATMTPQDYQNKRGDLIKQDDQLRQDYQNKRRALDTAVNGALDQIQVKSLAIVKQIVQQKSITMVLYKEAVAWGPNVVDITPDVVAQLNQQLPSVKF